MKEMSVERASLDRSRPSAQGRDKERMLRYKAFSIAFSYPDDNFFKFFPQALPEKERLILIYDRLFRASGLWLYTTEYLAENEFQRAKALSDIMGFYHAFKVEPDKKRPDSLEAEFEFMHYLIFKRIHALEGNIKDCREKANICFDAEKKFFGEHIYPGAIAIARKISLQKENNFYIETAKDLSDFLKSEHIYLGRANR